MGVVQGGVACVRWWGLCKVVVVVQGGGGGGLDKAVVMVVQGVGAGCVLRIRVLSRGG